MSTDVIELLDRAMRLPKDQRAELAERLVASLDEAPAPEVEEAWSVEIKRRLDALEAGLTKPIPWEDARRRIFGAIDGTDAT